MKACINIPHLLPFLKTISDENRLKILCFLKEKPQCVCDIVEFTKLPQNLVSHHLKKLKEIWIVNYEKKGLKISYWLDNKEIKTYIKELNNLLENKNLY